MARNIKIKEKSHAVSNGITVLVLIFAIAVCVIAAGNLYQIYGLVSDSSLQASDYQ